MDKHISEVEEPMIQPIKPSEVVAQKKDQTPDEVFEAFNELIAQNWNGNRSVFRLSEVTKLIEEKLEAKRQPSSGVVLDVKRSVDVDTNWLNVEEV